jgi:hypothetical protein
MPLTLRDLATVITPATSTGPATSRLGAAAGQLGNAFVRRREERRLKDADELARRKQDETERANRVREATDERDHLLDYSRHIESVMENANEIGKRRPEAALDFYRSSGLMVDELDDEDPKPKVVAKPPPEAVDATPPPAPQTPEEVAAQESLGTTAGPVPKVPVDKTKKVRPLTLSGTAQVTSPRIASTELEMVQADGPTPTARPDEVTAETRRMRRYKVTDPVTGRTWEVSYDAQQMNSEHAVARFFDSVIEGSRPEEKEAADMMKSLAQNSLPAADYDMVKAVEMGLDLYDRIAGRLSSERRARIMAAAQQAAAGRGDRRLDLMEARQQYNQAKEMADKLKVPDTLAQYQAVDRALAEFDPTNPQSVGAIVTALSRAVGEKGVLSNQDIQRVSGGMDRESYMARIGEWLANVGSGQMSVKIAQNIVAHAQSMRNALASFAYTQYEEMESFRTRHEPGGDLEHKRSEAKIDAYNQTLFGQYRWHRELMEERGTTQRRRPLGSPKERPSRKDDMTGKSIEELGEILK